MSYFHRSVLTGLTGRYTSKISTENRFWDCVYSGWKAITIH